MNPSEEFLGPSLYMMTTFVYVQFNRPTRVSPFITHQHTKICVFFSCYHLRNSSTPFAPGVCIVVPLCFSFLLLTRF